MRPRSSELAVKIYSIIVCYRPDKQQLLRLCSNLLSNGSKVILVDNTETSTISEQQEFANCKLIALGCNTGIAHAQNVGIAEAMADDADVIVFFDQDSRIEREFLKDLIAALDVGVPNVVCPLYLDEATNVELPSIRVNWLGLPKAIRCADFSASYPVDIVISSGTAATREVFQVVGLFDEDFFIDFVDTEWCLRCRSKKIPIRVAPNSVMHNRIGSKSINFGVVTVFVHSPARCYYQLRNCFHLFRKHHIPILFAVKETSSVFFSRILLLLVVKDKILYTKFYLNAIRDGLRGVVGSKPS